MLCAAWAGYRVEYEWRGVMTGEPRFQDELRQLARGYLSAPTVIFPDGTVMVEPRPDDVLDKLGSKIAGERHDTSSAHHGANG